MSKPVRQVCQQMVVEQTRDLDKGHDCEIPIEVAALEVSHQVVVLSVLSYDWFLDGLDIWSSTFLVALSLG